MTLFLTSLPVKDVANHSRVNALSMALCLVGTIDVALGEDKRENTGKKRGRLRATSLCAGSCLFLVTRATTVGLEHGGPPTAALGPYHPAMILGGVPITLGGVVVVGVCLLVTGDVRCPCPAQANSRLMSLCCSLCLNGACVKSEYSLFGRNCPGEAVFEHGSP